MYSGFITSNRSVSAVGVHQRFNKVAYKMVGPFLGEGNFPSIAQINHFEGINGPDGLKSKSPGKNEPSHLYDPYEDDGPIPELINSHYGLLVDKLKHRDMIGSAFEAAWLSHYIVDGLTPAHHFPLDKHLQDHGFKKNERGRYVIERKGLTHIDLVRKAWSVVGGKGLLTTHFNFEMGVATVILGQKIRVKLDCSKLSDARKDGPVDYFRKEALEIAEMNLYEKFYRYGWTPEIARKAKGKLAPKIVQDIGIIWLLAYLESGEELVKDVIAKEIVA